MKKILISATIGVFILTGTIWILSFSLESLTTITCKKEEETYGFCVVSKINSSGVKSTTLATSKIKAAKVETRIQNNSGSQKTSQKESLSKQDIVKEQCEDSSSNMQCQYRLILLLTTKDEILPLTDYQSGYKYESEQNKISTFLLNPNETSLNFIVERSYIYATSVSFLALALAIVTSIFSYKYLPLFDKYQNLANNCQKLSNHYQRVCHEYQNFQQQASGKYEELRQQALAGLGELQNSISDLEEGNRSLKTECDRYKGTADIKKREVSKLKQEKKILADKLKEFEIGFEYYQKHQNKGVAIAFNATNDIQPIFDNRKHEGDIMQEGTNINAGGDISGFVGGNVTGSTINLGAISGSVSNVVNQLPSASDPTQPGIKELLIELQAAIESDADLPKKGKASALENVKVLAEVAQDPEQPEKKGLGSQAVTFFKNAASFLPDTAKLAEACTKLLPLITKALGLPF
jgi:FtsZ-binding cell division protein ZapB